jgi:hypothetical protein
MRNVLIFGLLVSSSTAPLCAQAVRYNPVQSAPSADARQLTGPAPPISSYVTIVQSASCPTLVFNADPSPAPPVQIGQTLVVKTPAGACSGTIAKVENMFEIRHYPTVDVRFYATTITLK